MMHVVQSNDKLHRIVRHCIAFGHQALTSSKGVLPFLFNKQIICKTLHCLKSFCRVWSWVVQP